MRKITLAIVALATISSSFLFASESNRKHYKNERQQLVERIANELELTEVQKAEMQKIDTYIKDRMKSINDSDLTKEAKKRAKSTAF